MALEIYSWVAPILLLDLTVKDLHKIVQELKSKLLRIRLLGYHKEDHTCIFSQTGVIELTEARGSTP